MLSDRDRDRLCEVQRQLLAEDPGFVASFDAVGRRESMCWVPWAYDCRGGPYMTAMVVAMVVALALGLVVAMLMLSAPGSALLFAALAVVAAVL